MNLVVGQKGKRATNGPAQTDRGLQKVTSLL
jgi:hypothetical protein